MTLNLNTMAEQLKLIESIKPSFLVAACRVLLEERSCIYCGRKDIEALHDGRIGSARYANIEDIRQSR